MAKVNLLLNNTHCIQEHFLGANAVYHAFAFCPDEAGRAYSEEECAIEMQRVKKSGLKIARTYFEYPSHDNGKWNWEDARMQATYRWLDEMKKMDVTVAHNLGWWLGHNVFFAEELPFHDADPAVAADRFGAFVSEAVTEIVIKRGFDNVKYLFLFTEPNGATRGIMRKLGFTDEFEPYGLCVRAAHRHLVADGLRDRFKLVGPNAGQLASDPPEMLEWCVDHLHDELDVFTTHSYLDVDYADQPEWEAMCGNYCLRFAVPGYRAQQRVKLEPNTEYEASVWAKAENFTLEGNETRGFFLGAFYVPWQEEGLIRTISAGCDKLSNLTEGSVRHIDAAEMTGEWKQYKTRFNSGDNTFGYFGIYHDILGENAVGFYDKASLKKVGEDRELLENPDFDDLDSAVWTVYAEGFGGKNDPLGEYYYWRRAAFNFKKPVPDDKEFWFDEYNTRLLSPNEEPKKGISFASAQAGFINAGVNCSLLWTLFDQQWPDNHWDGFDTFVDGDHRCGTMPNIRRQKEPYPDYYAITLLTKYLGDQDSRVFEGNAGDGVCASILQGSDGHWAILAVNTGFEPCDLTLELEAPIDRKFYRHLYDTATVQPTAEADVLPIDGEYAVSNSLTDTLPPRSFAVYTTNDN